MDKVDEENWKLWQRERQQLIDACEAKQRTIDALRREAKTPSWWPWIAMGLFGGAGLWLCAITKAWQDSEPRHTIVAPLRDFGEIEKTRKQLYDTSFELGKCEGTLWRHGIKE